MKIPSLQEATAFLAEAEASNPGPWIQHSMQVGLAAQLIAQHHPDLCPDTAYVLGYLHDIGRRAGVTDLRHIIDGYQFLNDHGYPDAAQICVTHAFPLLEIHSAIGQWDCSDKEFQFVSDFITKIKLSEYDRLIQLCDAITLSSGYCLMEKRLVDVALRHGVNEYTVLRWKAFLKIQNVFENTIGRSIYNVLPGIIENTFGFIPLNDQNEITGA